MSMSPILSLRNSRAAGEVPDLIGGETDGGETKPKRPARLRKIAIDGDYELRLMAAK
jgi:hypothetical protein